MKINSLAVFCGRVSALCLVLAVAPFAAFASTQLFKELDAPLLFVKRHAYMSPHIYDDYYMFRPGGGIYVIENPSAPPEQRRIRAVIDSTSKETLGTGVYRDPELSWDAKKLLFAFKGEAEGSTSIYEIGIDGTGLRRLTNPEIACTKEPPVRAYGGGRHDISPCYLPDGRIVFTSTRQAGRVPCFNSEVDTLHVMDANGENVRPISVNNVNEFDPVVMPDGRVLYGRWEYVDKTALYMQSLWTVFPDGSNETAFFGNNMAKPTAFLHARPVPNSHLIAASLTPHNGQAVGAIAMIDPHLGKNNLGAIFNFTPEHPTEMDQGLMRGPCDPWPLSENKVLISNNGKTEHSVLEIITRDGRRELLHSEPAIGCFAPMLVKPRPVPPTLSSHVEPGKPARFFVQDVYRGLDGVERGEITRLRVIEETARISGIPPGGRWWNQAFLLSWQGAYTVKNFLGVVPVQEDGSAYFDAPPGRALYFQALDREGKMVQSMRTFIQATPGTTRSCVGCHEYKDASPSATISLAHLQKPTKPEPETWGNGFIDYPTMIQPIWNKNCVSCHGEKEIAGGMDLTGGWTWAFNISYETLIKNTQVGFLNCNNEAMNTAKILPPKTHGSSAAPLADLLITGHGGRIPNLSQQERDLVLAWMDGNCNYYGTWDWTENATCQAVLSAGQRLTSLMQQANCTSCHAPKVGNDWMNLQQPELSRILRAPLAETNELGLGLCRDRKARDVLPLVVSAHQPPDVFNVKRVLPPDSSGEKVVSFESVADENYEAMFRVIREARTESLANPRVDMPSAPAIAGMIRRIEPMMIPAKLPALIAQTESDGLITLNWERSAETIGLTFEIHRSTKSNFKPSIKTKLLETGLFHFTDTTAEPGLQHYALVLLADSDRSPPSRNSIVVPPIESLASPEGLKVTAEQGANIVAWNEPKDGHLRFNIYRSPGGSNAFAKVNSEPFLSNSYTDEEIEPETTYDYRVTTMSRRSIETEASPILSIVTRPEKDDPVFVARFLQDANAILDDKQVAGQLNGKAVLRDNALDLREGGNVTFTSTAAFEIRPRFSVECWVRLERTEKTPVLLSYGRWKESGWFLQKFQTGWRWHVAGIDCDGGKAVADEWTHLLATYDGRATKLFQNGRLVASVEGAASRTPWSRHLYVGQYGASRSQEFQVTGQIKDVKIYHRAIRAEEALSLAGKKPIKTARND
ncbi:MAG: PD40 domain-containing protein [Verrucomicrobia bacterium]|nr:PD40 domain-containing protein [Verrucomicrobiota bacterium]